MNVDPREARGATRWFFGAGACAVALSVFLAVSDYRLSHSDGERVLGATLRELRTAQAALPSGVSDERIFNGTLGFKGAEAADAAEGNDSTSAQHGH